MRFTKEFLKARAMQLDILDRHKEEIDGLREKAMRVAEDAFFLARDGKRSESVGKYQEAFKLEKQVADWFIATQKPKAEIEPSRTVVCLSAAHLAADGGLDKEATYYAAKVIEFGLNKDSIDEAKSIINHIQI